MSSRPPRGAARLAAILDALPDALLLVNCNGTVVNANAIALEVLESPGTALVGRGLLDLLPEFDPNRIPGSMRRPDEDEGEARTRPTRMIARRTDGSEFPVEVTSANLEDGRTPYASSFEAAWADHGTGRGTSHYTGDELLMLVVRDLTGTLDTEAELARQQRQTEMILRAASEGVVGVDGDGRVVLVNPAAAQILGYRAGDLGGKELHPLVHHSRPDGSSLPFEETPLHDTLRSGRKHRVRAGQVLWAKDGSAVPVAMTTAPVRDGEQLVGAVLTFTDRRPYVALRERHEQLRAVLDEALRGPLDQLRDELGGLADDPAGQLWPEANQILHHLSAGYARMTTLVDNVLAYQRLQTGKEKLRTERVSLDGVVASGVDGAVELIGPGRAQFAVHAPPIEAEVDPQRLATALAHLIADVAGVDATGARSAAATGDSTIVVAVAQRGEVVRIEVRGPHPGGSPVHEPVVRGIVQRHGGVLQTHEVPGAGGSAFVLEVPCAAEPAAATDGGGAEDAGTGGAGTSTDSTGGGLDMSAAQQTDNDTTVMPVPSQPRRGTEAGPQAAVPAARQGEAGPSRTGATEGDGRSGTSGGAAIAPAGSVPAQGGPYGPEQHGQAAPGGQDGPVPQEGAGTPRPTGRRRRGRPDPAEQAALGADPAGDGHRPPEGHAPAGQAQGQPSEGQAAPGTALALPGGTPPAGTGRRARRALATPPAGTDSGQSGTGQPDGPTAHGQGTPALPPAPGGAGVPGQGAAPGGSGPVPHQIPPGTGRRARRRQAPPTGTPGSGEPPAQGTEQAPDADQAAQVPAVAGGGRRARRLAAARARAEAQAAGQAPSQEPFALPPAGTETGEDPQAAYAAAQAGGAPVNGAAPAGTGPRARQAPAGTPQAPQPQQARQAPQAQQAQQPPPQRQQPPQQPGQPALPPAGGGAPGAAAGGEAGAAPPARAAGNPGPNGGVQPPEQAGPHGHRPALPRPNGQAKPQGEQSGTGGISVRTLGQGVPFAARLGEQGRPTGQAEAPPSPAPAIPSTPSTPHPPPGSGRRRKLGTRNGEQPASAQGGGVPSAPQQGQGREFAIGAPDASAAEGPEPLDGPNGAVEVTDGGGMTMPLRPVDDELPPEPLDNPRRLLVWPEPDPSTQQALSARGYRPVIVNSREEVDAQIAAYPAALFVDPLTGPITRTALQSLRQAAVAAEVPVLVTAGLGQATRETAYGADPAVLLKALAPRDSEQHPPRVLLVEENEQVAAAFTQSLERRGMQVAHAPSDSDAVNIAAQIHPNLVVMDLMQVRRRRAGIIDWLRVNGILHRTPFVVYTSADMDPAGLPRLATGENVLFLAERSTADEVQSRIVDLLTKIGAH